MTVRVISRELENVRTEQNHCQGLRIWRKSYWNVRIELMYNICGRGSGELPTTNEEAFPSG
jgi:hypothetical protein